MMDKEDILNSLEHEFLMVSMKRDLDRVTDPEELRQVCLQLITLLETQKQLFKDMVFSLIEDDDPYQT